jgi:hypothetical protein
MLSSAERDWIDADRRAREGWLVKAIGLPDGARRARPLGRVVGPLCRPRLVPRA